jgi:hypothetical protein
MTRFLAPALALATLGVAAPALAAQIDFRTSAFSSANWQPSFSYTASDGVTLTITPGPRGATLYQDSTDGLGVRFSYEADEIEAKETLTIGFSEEVLLSDLFLTDLFNESGYLERGAYAVNGGTTKNWFTADPGQTPGTNGELTLDVGTYVTSITFSAPGKLMFGLQNHEFSLGGLDYSRRAVPELDPSAGASTLLLLLGMLAVLSERRRRSAV